MTEQVAEKTEETGVVETPEVETKAREIGWMPKEEFKGDPAKWRDAAEFLSRGEKILPILKKSNETLRREIAELRGTVKEFADHHKKVSEIQYAKAIKDLRRQKDEAIEVGDKAKVKEVESEMKDLETTKPTASEGKGKSAEADQHYADFVKENPWWGKDADMTEYARAQSAFIERRMSHIPVNSEDFFNEVAKRVKKEFPEKFTNDRRTQPSAVHGAGADTKGTDTKGKGFRDLPDDAKKACQSFVKAGFLTQEQYLKDYFA